MNTNRGVQRALPCRHEKIRHGHGHRTAKFERARDTEMLWPGTGTARHGSWPGTTRHGHGQSRARQEHDTIVGLVWHGTARHGLSQARHGLSQARHGNWHGTTRK